MSRKLLRHGALIAIFTAVVVLLGPTVRFGEGRMAIAQTAQKAEPGIPGLQQPSANAVEKDAKVYGQKVHYMEAGSGPAVILLHGLGGDLTNWASTIGPLSEKYHVIVPDQIGFGHSDKPLINYRVGTLVDFLDGFYKELKIENLTLKYAYKGAPPRAMSLEDEPTPKPGYVFVRGNSANRGDQVERQFLQILAGENRKPFANEIGRAHV